MKKFGSPTKEVVRYKTHLVAKDCNQKKGVDYNEIFSPIVQHTSIHVLLVLLETLDMELEKLISVKFQLFLGLNC